LSPSTNTITNFTNAAVLFALLLPYHFHLLKILSLTNSLFCADTSIDGYVFIKITQVFPNLAFFWLPIFIYQNKGFLTSPFHSSQQV
jgi:hypothetical protein